jgi:DNA-binding MarR family transcriptional regulator
MRKKAQSRISPAVGARKRPEEEGWMAETDDHVRLIAILRYTFTGLVGRQGRDLTARQLAVFLICYLEEGAQTVRGLSGQLNVSKPAIVRALDRLEQSGLVRRLMDPSDRRSILVGHTRKGLGFLKQMNAILQRAAKRA